MRLTALVLWAAVLSAADPNAATEALARLEQKTANLPPALAVDFRMLAAQSLHKTHPDLAARLVQQTLDELRRSKDLKPSRVAVRILAELAPRDVAAAIPLDSRADLVSAFFNNSRPVEAAAVFRDLLPSGKTPLTLIGPLFAQLLREHPAEARRLFSDIAAAIDPKTAEPVQAWRLVEAARAIAPISPSDAAASAEAVLKAAADPEYGKGAKIDLIVSFGPVKPLLSSASSREAVLIGAGSVLAAAAPGRVASYQAALGKWDVAKLSPVGVTYRPAGQTPPSPNPVLASFSRRLAPYRSLPTDADRARLALDLVADLDKLPGFDQFAAARSLSHLITEGDMGKLALAAVTRTFARGIVAAGERAGVDDWTHLASLIRYERVDPPIADPALDAAMALLDVRESVLQGATFTLTALDGKSYSLAALRGKVVLLNFWATWCPPCRKELPDLDKLYREFGPKGFVVLAVSDEDRATVEGYLAKQSFTFPVLLDPGRKVHTAFDVEGIPKNFLFDREGKLAGQTIDMRTESQFRELLKRAGLE